MRIVTLKIVSAALLNHFLSAADNYPNKAHLIASAINLMRFASWKAEVPHAMTRTSRFAAPKASSSELAIEQQYPLVLEGYMLLSDPACFIVSQAKNEEME